MVAASTAMRGRGAAGSTRPRVAGGRDSGRGAAAGRIGAARARACILVCACVCVCKRARAARAAHSERGRGDHPGRRGGCVGHPAFFTHTQNVETLFRRRTPTTHLSHTMADAGPSVAVATPSAAEAALAAGTEAMKVRGWEGGPIDATLCTTRGGACVHADPACRRIQLRETLGQRVESPWGVGGTGSCIARARGWGTRKTNASLTSSHPQADDFAAAVDKYGAALEALVAAHGGEWVCGERG